LLEKVEGAAVAADSISQGLSCKGGDDYSLAGETAGVEKAGLDLAHEWQAGSRDGERSTPCILDSCVVELRENT
jgi:hypothetical protein